MHARGRFQQAGKLYKKILTTYPNHPDVLHLLGLTAFQTGNYKSAVKSIEQAIRINPNNPDFHNDCGEAYRALRDYDSAARCYEKALALNPDFAEAHNNMGNLLNDVERLDDALVQYKKAIELKDDYYEAYYNMANVLRKTGRLDSAIESYIQALKLNPDIAEAHHNLGTAYREKNQPDKAGYHFKCALRLKPGNILAHINLGLLYFERGNPEAAIIQYQNALLIQPENFEAHYNLAGVYYSIQRLRFAEEHIRKALLLKPDNANACNYLGMILSERGDTAEAIIHYKKSLILKPDFPEAHNNLASAYQDIGDFHQAEKHFTMALSLKPDYVEVYRHLAILSKEILSEESIHHIQSMLDNPGLQERDAMHLHFALGDIYNRINSYDKAFHHYHEANKIKRKTLSFDIDEHRAYVDRLIKIFDSDYFQNFIPDFNQSELPLFIIGMPRSGTTLVEQIIASHPQVFGAGELNNFLHIEQTIASLMDTSMPYPECMEIIDEKTATELIDDYLNCLKTYSSSSRYVTDKLPDNFLRLGLIKTLFPKARIIHCMREPLDTCLSIYCSYFTGGHSYAYDLVDLGHYYREYERIMSHWLNLFKAHIFNVEYRELVMNQEQTTRNLLEFLGLPWNNDCLNFYNNRRPVQTASNVDIRRPIYNLSLNRWKNYEAYLKPLNMLIEQDPDNETRYL